MKKEKLWGIELCRGLATYAVILVHSGDEAWGLPIDASAIAFRLFFYFAVPFFLAAAFYFVTARPDLGRSLKFWQLRIERILVPYAAWSGIFLVARIAVFTIKHQPEQLQALLQDPLAIVFFGGASYHLYFLPLLLTGTTLVLLTPWLSGLKLGKLGWLALSALSVGCYYLLEATGNSFQLGTYVAFGRLMSLWQIDLEQHRCLRLLLVEAAWIIKCLPYFLVALTLHQVFRDPGFLRGKLAVAGWAISFLLLNIFGKMLLFSALQEILLAYSLLFLGITLSNYRKAGSLSRLAASAGACSFGIYFIHPFVMNLIKPIVKWLSPEITASVSIDSILILSVSCFFGSWGVVYLTQNRVAVKYLFGV